MLVTDRDCYLEPLLSPLWGGRRGRTEGGHGDLRWPGSPWKERVGFEQAWVLGPGCKMLCTTCVSAANVIYGETTLRSGSDVVPPCVGARTTTSAGARFRTFDAVDGPDVGARQCQCLEGVAPLLIYYLLRSRNFPQSDTG